MKNLIVFLLFIFSSFHLSAQEKNVITGHYQVSGLCERCKKRIEDAAYIKGVKYAEWNVQTHMLTVTYRPSKTSADAILEHIAKAGHDSEKIKATDDDYHKLPSCCYYRTISNK